MVKKGQTIAKRTPNRYGTRADSKLSLDLQYKIIFDLENAGEGKDSPADIIAIRDEYRAPGIEGSVRNKVNRLKAKKLESPEVYL